MKLLKGIAWVLMLACMTVVTIVGIVTGMIAVGCLGLTTVLGAGMGKIEEDFKHATPTEPIVSCVRGEMVSVYEHSGKG